MAKVNIANLSKAKIVELYKGKCKHGHRYIEHYGCYLEEADKPLRVGFLDIETTNLKADWGIILCYCIKVARSRSIIGRCITPEEIKSPDMDKNVVKQLIKDMEQFDLLVTFYGTKFDLPFIRTRAICHKLNFHLFGLIQHKDLYYVIKNKFRLSRNGLENSTRVLLGKTHKTHSDLKKNIKAMQGDEKSLQFIYEHCIKDVVDTEALYNQTIGYVKNTTKSI